MFEIVPDGRAIFIYDIKALVVADLHIGYEQSLKEKGIILRGIEDRMLNQLKTLMDYYSADKLIIVGDVKHNIGIDRKVKKLESFASDLIVVKGNHDGSIEDTLNAKIYDSRGFRIGRYGFIHGHAWPAKEIMHADYVFMGHIHPEVELKDSQGKEHRYPCFLMGELTDRGKEMYSSNSKIVILPAFNPLAGASISDLGPLLKNKIIGNFDVYLINGAYLGKLEDIQSPSLV